MDRRIKCDAFLTVSTKTNVLPLHQLAKHKAPVTLNPCYRGLATLASINRCESTVILMAGSLRIGWSELSVVSTHWFCFYPTPCDLGSSTEAAFLFWLGSKFRDQIYKQTVAGVDCTSRGKASRLLQSKLRSMLILGFFPDRILTSLALEPLRSAFCCGAEKEGAFCGIGSPLLSRTWTEKSGSHQGVSSVISRGKLTFGSRARGNIQLGAGG